MNGLDILHWIVTGFLVGWCWGQNKRLHNIEDAEGERVLWAHNVNESLKAIKNIIGAAHARTTGEAYYMPPRDIH